MTNKWDLKYSTASYDFTPNQTLTQLLPLLTQRPGARALDLACGGGRNSLLLAEAGWQVDAWDYSEPGIRLLQGEAARRGITPQIHTKVLDLEAVGFTLPDEKWDVIVNAFFLHRPLLDQLPRAVRPGGWLFAQTFVNLGHGANSHVQAAFKLEPGELRSRFPGWTALVDEESTETGLATLVTQKPA